MLAAIIATRGILVTSLFPPNGIIEVPYTYTLTAIGGIGPYTWSFISGELPPGLSLTSDGVISGTPTLIGAYPFVVQVADSTGFTAFGLLTIHIGLYGNQFIAATTTFPCIAFAKRAAALTTDASIAHTLLFSSASQLAVRDALEAQYVKMIGPRATDDRIFLSHTIFETIPIVAQLNSILQTLPVTDSNLPILADMQARCAFALYVLQQKLFVFPE